jgi:hypothetical protein
MAHLAPGGAAPRALGQVAAPISDRYGVVSTSGLGVVDTEALIPQVGARWWYSYEDPFAVRSPYQLRLVRIATPEPIAPERYTAAAAAAPGGLWQIGNEPNVPMQDEIDPAVYAERYHAAYHAIKAGDPTARVLAAGVLSWDFTCTGCLGFRAGHDWTDAFWQAYRARYGVDPPADGWAMHPYLVDWANLPMRDSATTIAQITGMRAYLDAAGYPEAPLWLTEVGVIWGCEQAVYPVNAKIGCVNYRADLMEVYMSEVLGWLNANADAYHIARWYWYATAPVTDPYVNEFGGIALFEAPGFARPSRFGQLYRLFSEADAASTGTGTVPVAPPAPVTPSAPAAPFAPPAVVNVPATLVGAPVEPDLDAHLRRALGLPPR